MLIKEVCKKYNITADALRYYEHVGAIPKVSRTSGGIRDFSEEDFMPCRNPDHFIEDREYNMYEKCRCSCGHDYRICEIVSNGR